MTLEERIPVVAEVDGVHQEIEESWHTRTTGRPMPRQLWAAAVKLKDRRFTATSASADATSANAAGRSANSLTPRRRCSGSGS